MKKIQSFHIIKLDSDRLKEFKYNITDLSLEQARINGELVSFANSELIRVIQRVRGKRFSQSLINELTEEKKKISRKRNKTSNRIRLIEINEQLDDMLFIPEVISVSFHNRKHFQNILDRDGFLVNGIRYVPFLASAGMTRRDMLLFIDASIKEEIDLIFQNGRNQEVELVPAKYNAYYALYSSSTLPVTFPEIIVVSDMIIKEWRRVDHSTYIGDGIDPDIREVSMEMEFNAFDGAGLMSPQMAKIWQQDLELDYLPSALGVRAPFLKGMCVTFDFHTFAEKIAGNYFVKDIYGNTVDIRKVDCIVSESMFKLWSSYSSTQEYLSKCSENNLTWGISKVNAKQDKTFCKSSYQFLQVLNLSDEEIENLCQPTIDWLNYVSGGDMVSTLLYLLGEMKFTSGWFNRLDAWVQALLLDNELLKDTYITSYLDKTIAKKKNDAKMGRLIFNGNYSAMIPDPYAYAAHVFGLGLQPLLHSSQHYSHFWKERNVKTVAAIRSPIVHSSEVNVLNFVNDNDDVNYWYQYVKSGIVYPANGVGMDFVMQGGADSDYDLTATINSPEIVNGIVYGHPITYDTRKAEKVKITKENEHYLRSSQLQQIKTNKIGFFTNVSSTLYALLSNFEKGSHEALAILQRLKYGRVLQGLAIDSAKGIIVDPFPAHWVEWKRIADDMSDGEKQYHEFNNRILADKRPLFMRWLYSHYNRKYIRELSIANNISMVRWNVSFDELKIIEHKTTEQIDFINRYYRRSSFIDNESTMNRISKYVEKAIHNIRFVRKDSGKFDYTHLLSEGFTTPRKTDVEKMTLLWKEWKSLKKSLAQKRREHEDGSYDSLAHVATVINRKAYATISSNSSYLADLAVYTCYKILGKNSKSYVWTVFGKEVVENIRQRKQERFVRVPLKSEKGQYEYLWNRYSIYTMSIEE